MHGGGSSFLSPGVWLAVSVLLVAGINVWNMLHLDLDGDARIASLMSSFAPVLRNGTYPMYPFSDESSTTLDLGQMTKSLIDSMTSAEGVMPTIMPRQFPRHMVSTVNPNTYVDAALHPKECECDILTVDCINYISCIPIDRNHRHAMVHLGIETRNAIKQTTTFEGDVQDSPNAPIGKGHQYAAMAAWNSWVEASILPKKYPQNEPHDFINETFYPHCQASHRRGKSCFFARTTDPEDVKRGVLEKQAIKWFSSRNHNSDEIEMMRTKLQEFIIIHRQQLQDVHEARDKALNSEKSHSGITLPTSSMSPLGHLMMFSHLVRLLFQPRPFLLEIYEKKMTIVVPNQPEEQRIDDTMAVAAPFTVSVHMRRGDSCHFDEDSKQQYPFEKEASSLHSRAQTSNVRKCYETGVYLQVLERIRDLLPTNQPLHVYLSTDDTGSVMKEIAANHTHVYKNVVDQWHYLDYSRSHFQYDLTEFIESESNQNRPMMGEAAATDLWLLSHGQAFVGHLGSRFGKVAWYMATSRHNSFIPYFSIDGHSVCCEIDESCGSVRKYVFDMENCLTFSHELLDSNVGDFYWELGSLARKSEYRHVFRLKRYKKGEEAEQR